MVVCNIFNHFSDCRNCCCHCKQGKNKNDSPMPCCVHNPSCLSLNLCYWWRINILYWTLLLLLLKSLALMKITLINIMLGKIKVNVTSVNDPKRLMKSPIKGMAAVTIVFPINRSARRKNRLFKFSLEYIPSLTFRNLVSRASWTGWKNIWHHM